MPDGSAALFTAATLLEPASSLDRLTLSSGLVVTPLAVGRHLCSIAGSLSRFGVSPLNMSIIWRRRRWM
jgi:hypothetical protein